MSSINQLSSTDSVISSDQVPIYSSTNGDARKASMSVLADFFSKVTAAQGSFLTQYAAPSATGFNIAVNNASNNVWLLLTPVAGYAAGSITLPALANCVDKQEVLFNSTQAVTTFTVNGNGATVTGAPTSFAANGFFRLRFDGVFKGWYRVG